MEEDYFDNNLPEYTQDMFKLEQAENHLVFDCGPLLYDVPYIRTAYTVEKMSLWKFQMNRYSMAVPVRMPGAPKARIRGTLYLMSTEEVLRLDRTRQNGVSFERKETQVVVTEQDEYGHPACLPRPVWMYRACKQPWIKKIEWDLAYNRRTGNNFVMADTFQATDKFLNNHFSFTSVQVEDQSLPEITATRASELFQKYCSNRNTDEVKRLKGMGLLSKLRFRPR